MQLRFYVVSSSVRLCAIFFTTFVTLQSTKNIDALAQKWNMVNAVFSFSPKSWQQLIIAN